jgi:hypothetical protein
MSVEHSERRIGNEEMLCERLTEQTRLRVLHRDPFRCLIKNDVGAVGRRDEKPAADTSRLQAFCWSFEVAGAAESCAKHAQDSFAAVVIGLDAEDPRGDDLRIAGWYTAALRTRRISSCASCGRSHFEINKRKCDASRKDLPRDGVTSCVAASRKRIERQQRIRARSASLLQEAA